MNKLPTKKGLIENTVDFAKKHPIITALIVSELCSSNSPRPIRRYADEIHSERIEAEELKQELEERLRQRIKEEEEKKRQWEAKSNDEKLQILRSRIINIENTVPKKSTSWHIKFLDFLEMICYKTSYYFWNEKYKKELSLIRNDYNKILKDVNNERTNLGNNNE